MPSYAVDNAGRMDGPEVRRLMRTHGTTIRDLAGRMQISMKRVREIRDAGTPTRHHSWEYILWITGEKPWD
jgi:hypothetical protein